MLVGSQVDFFDFIDVKISAKSRQMIVKIIKMVSTKMQNTCSINVLRFNK